MRLDQSHDGGTLDHNQHQHHGWFWLDFDHDDYYYYYKNQNIFTSRLNVNNCDKISQLEDVKYNLIIIQFNIAVICIYYVCHHHFWMEQHLDVRWSKHLKHETTMKDIHFGKHDNDDEDEDDQH